VHVLRPHEAVFPVFRVDWRQAASGFCDLVLPVEDRTELVELVSFATSQATDPDEFDAHTSLPRKVFRSPASDAMVHVRQFSAKRRVVQLFGIFYRA
jgi:hypothetical protein